MPISLSHLGEELIATMAERERIATVVALGLTELADLAHVRSTSKFAFHECKLARHQEYIFDGTSRVGMVLWIRPELAVPLELK